MKKSVFLCLTISFSTLLLLAMLLCLPLLKANAQQLQLKSFKVEVSGKGSPMILIPGLSCSGEVWDETVARYRKEYECHVLTLAGFAGQPPVPSDAFLKTVRDDLATYIREQKLNKPVVVGHSLGGFVGMWLSAKEPELVGALLVVDSAPFLPALINPFITVEGAKAMAETHRMNIQSQTPEQLRQTQPLTLRNMISDEANIEKAAQWTYASDANTVGKAIYELYTTDLRAELGVIRTPTLVMASWVAYQAYGTTHQSTELNFNSQFKLLPNYELVINDKAKHFIMWDDPEGFYDAMDAFLAKNNFRNNHN